MWEGADQGKVEYGARCVHLLHFMRYSESILIRVDRGTMLNRHLVDLSIEHVLVLKSILPPP